MNQVVRYLVFLCWSISMGVMIWVMMRGMHAGNEDERSGSDRLMAQLEWEVKALRARPERETVEMR